VQDLLVNGIHSLVVAAAVLHHPGVLPRGLKPNTPPQNKIRTQTRQPNRKASERLTEQPHPPREDEEMPGKLPEPRATARSATRTAPAAAYHHRLRCRRRLPSAAPFATGAGSEDIAAPGAEGSRSEIWIDSNKFFF
jgi:hypothetical protein